MVQKVPQSSISGNSSFRSLLINGDMSICQRQPTQPGIQYSGYYSLDRWYLDISSTGTWTLSQSTTVPTGQGFFNSSKFDCTTADTSLGSGDRLFYQQRIEDQFCTFLKKGTSSTASVTVSFWVRSNKTGTYICEIYDSHNSRHISKSYTIDSADTWEKKIIVFPGDTTGAFANDNGVGLQLDFWLAAGTNYTSGTLATSWQANDATDRAVGQTVNLADSTSNEWYLTGVQLEAGDAATGFEHLPHDVQLDRCMRYCYVHNNDADSSQALIFPGASRGGTNKYFYIQHPRPMRDTPSVTVSGEIRIINCTAGDQADADDTLAIGGVTPSIQGQNANEKGVTIAYTGAVSGITDTANTGYMMMFIKETDNRLTIDAEL